MSKNYLITLTPLEPFFFGGEHTFGEGEQSRYFAKSELFPQQSALLGMLRKAILNKKNIMTLHKKGEWIDSRKKEFAATNANYKEAVRLVGKGKFDYLNDFDTGVLKNISPLFILKDKNSYFIDAKDASFTPRYDEHATMRIKGSDQPTLLFDGYNAKNPTSLKFRSKNEVLQLSKLYTSVQTVGIKKSKNGKTLENAFFTKESFILQDNAKFAFLLEAHEDMHFLNNTLLTLGADRSSFMLQISQTDQSFETIHQDIFKPKPAFDRLVLLSETLLDQKVYDLCEFILGDRKPMRYMISKKKEWAKSRRYFLLQRGTVIYTKEHEKLTKALSIKHLQKTGINKFSTLKGDA